MPYNVTRVATLIPPLNMDNRSEDAKAAVDWARFSKWQLVLGLFHVAASLAVVVVIAVEGDWDVPVHVTFSAWQSIANGTNFTSGLVVENKRPVEARSLLHGTMPLGVIVSTFSLFSASNHFATYATRDGIARQFVEEGVNRFRWADYALSSSLMLMVNSVLWASPPDLASLVLWFVVQFLVIVAGYASEVAWSKNAYRDANAIFALALVAYTAVWGAPWSQFVISMSGDSSATAVGGRGIQVAENDPPDLVYALLAWLCGTFFLFPLVHVAKLRSASTQNLGDNLRYEVVYSFLSLFSKIPLMLTFASGVSGRAGRERGESGGSDALMTLGIASTVSVGVGILLAVDLLFYRNTPGLWITGPWRWGSHGEVRAGDVGNKPKNDPASEKLLRT